MPFEQYLSTVQEKTQGHNPTKQYIKLLWKRSFSVEDAVKKINRHW